MELIFGSFAGTNDCSGPDSKSKCDFMCLPVGEKNHSCACPENLRNVNINPKDSCKCPTGKFLHRGICHPGKKSCNEISTS